LPQEASIFRKLTVAENVRAVLELQIDANGKSLSENAIKEKLQALLKDLFACEMPYCCPHGRPTLVQIGTAELERKFGRRAPT
jgi:DNA mismatch repair ATPase MutL